MNDKERNSRLHENLVGELDMNEETRFLRSGLSQEEQFLLTFFHLFFDPSDQAEWILRYRSCLLVPTPRQTVGSNGDVWIKLYMACAKINIDWPGKERFLISAGERFQREFEDIMRKRYSRTDEQIAKLSEKLGKAQEHIGELEEELCQTRENHADGETLFAKRIALYVEQLTTYQRQRGELDQECESIKKRLIDISSHMSIMKGELPQYRQGLNDAREEYNAAFDTLRSDQNDTIALNDAHGRVMAAVKALQDHQSTIEQLDRDYVHEANNHKTAIAKFESLPQQLDHLGKAVQILETARKLFGYDGQVDIASLFPSDTHSDSEAEAEEDVLTAELVSLLDGMTLLQLIGPRSIKAARDAAHALKLENTTEFAAAIISGELEAQLNETVSGHRLGIAKKSAETLLTRTIPNLKRHWMTKGIYDQEKMRSHFMEKLNYNAAFGREQSQPLRETA